jgi:hypothetical protein
LKHQRILDWLKVCDPSSNHVAARAKHQAHTGSWFIGSTDFADWRDNKIRSLWLHGIPGAGKTIFCSTIIEEVTTICATRSDEFAYFYFDFNDVEKQIVDGFLRSVVLQNFIHRAGIPSDIQSLYDRCRGNQPTREALVGTLLSLLKSSTRTYILIDALDECSERS